MRIRIEARELKTLLEKVLPEVPKKPSLPILGCVLLEAKDNNLTASATDLETWLTVKTDKFNNNEDGKILIHSDDVKLITKLTGDIEIKLLHDKEIIFTTGKKAITIDNHDIDSYPKFFIEDEIPEVICSIQETQFTNAINKLVNFTSDNENNKMMRAYYINLKRNRIEALDGHRIGINDITPEVFKEKPILLFNYINSKLKKVLSSKSMDYLQINEYKNHCISITGKDFTYIQRTIEGEYYKIDQMLFTDYSFKMTVDKNELQDITKFNIDMLKQTQLRKPMVIKYNKDTDNHFIYLDNGKNKTIDKLNTISHDMSGKDLMIGFNPVFINDTMKCLDDDKAIITGMNPKAPILIKGTNERYLILPVNISQDDELEEKINQLIRDVA